MINSALKILAFGGSLLIGTGTLLGSNFASPRKEAELTAASFLKSRRSSRPCTVYIAEEPIWHKNRRAFWKMKQKFNDPEEFLRTVRGVWNIQELETKIRNRCSKREDTYLWQGDITGRGRTWIYASDMNEGGYNWVTANRIINESGGILQEE